ncbi:hypothetical protein [Mycobacterium sp. C31M]
MGTINGATAAAEPDSPSVSETTQSTSDSGGHGDNDAPGPDDSDETPSTEDHETDTDPEDQESDEDAAPPLTDESDTSDDSPGAGAALPDPPESEETDSVIEAPAHSNSENNFEAAAPATSPVVHDTPEPMPLALAGPIIADVAAIPTTAPVPEVVATPEPALPAVAIVAPTPTLPAVPMVAAPLIEEAVAQLVQTLVLVAVDVVEAIIALIADLRAVPGIVWARAGGGGAYPSSAFLPKDTIMAMLTTMLARSFSAGVGSSVAGSALVGISLDRIMSAASTLRPDTQPLAEARSAAPTDSAPAQTVVTALAAMSLWALLSGALPGLGGLFVCAATGVRLGYRQARARMTLHRTELARFVRAGPIGIVRNGTQVTIHARSGGAEITPRGRHLRLAS